MIRLLKSADDYLDALETPKHEMLGSVHRETSVDVTVSIINHNSGPVLLRAWSLFSRRLEKQLAWRCS